MAEGKATKEIARDLDVSTKTIETHRKVILERLGVSNTAAAVSLAAQEGLLGEEKIVAEGHA